MIPDSPLTINVSSVEVDNKNKFIEEIKRATQEQNESFWFNVDSVNQTAVYAKLVSTTSTKITTVGENGEIASQTIIEANEIPFGINFESGILEVFDNKDSKGEVINRLGQISHNLVTRDVTVDLSEVLRIFSEKDINMSTSGIRINNYSPIENTNGNCYLNVFEKNTARNILSEYGKDISYISVELSEGSDSEPVTVGFYRSGSVRVFSKLQEGDPELESIRKIAHEVI